jgi:hypothetical protein
MIGALIGAGMSVAGGIAGGIAQAKAAKAQRQAVERRKQENQSWYDRRYNEDPTQRASAQRMITLVSDSIRNRNRAAAGTQAVMGGTDESLAATKEANNQALSGVTSRIAAEGDARKDAIEEKYLNRKDAISQEEDQLNAEKAKGIAGAIAGVAGAAGGIGSSLSGITSKSKQPSPAAPDIDANGEIVTY